MINGYLTRLRAEPMGMLHFEALREMHTNAAMMQWIGGVRDAASTQAYLEKHLLHWREHGYGFWILFETGKRRAIGLAGLRRLELDGAVETEFGYGFLPEAWGKGYATETALACVAYGTRELKVPSLVALTDPSNEGSIKVLLKAGLEFERRLERDQAVSDFFRTRPLPASS